MASVTIFGNFLNETFVRESLHSQVYSLGNSIAALVRDKTPVLTGTLQSSTWFYEEYDPASDLLAEIYWDQSYQINQWGRVYEQYVEGPPLGHTTWTNPPRQVMLSTSVGDGLVVTAAWAVLALQGANVIGTIIP